MIDVSVLIPNLPKRKNMSADIDKTKERCLATWKSLKNVQKNEVLALADVTASTLHKTYKLGHISAAVAIAIAKVAGVSPLYLCGETDKPGKYTDRTLSNFLSAHGLYNPIENTPEEADTESEKSAVPEQLAAGTVLNECVCEICGGEPEDGGVDAEDLTILLEALIIRSYYRPECAERLQKITELLLGPC